MMYVASSEIMVEDDPMRHRNVVDVKTEPMFFRASCAYARAHGGPIMHEFLDRLDATRPWVIDSRAHMLMRQWYPAIPGWHGDDVPRGSDGQPVYLGQGEGGGDVCWRPEWISEHRMVVIDAADAPTGSMTEFASGRLSVPHPYLHRPGEAVYAKWSDAIDVMGQGHRRNVESGRVVHFDGEAMHRAVPARSPGWRYFIRASIASYPPENEIRYNANVYLAAVNAGW